MSSKKEKVEEGKGRSLEDVLSELSKYDELKAEAREHIESQIAVHESEIQKLRQKLIELGFAQLQAPGRTRKASDGERKQRTCPKCGELGHRWNKCTGTPQESWAQDPRSQG